MADVWGMGARRAARPVVLCAALGVGSFALTFVGALLLGRGLAGSALAALLLPLALSGALAVGLAVTFVVAVAVEQPNGIRRVSRLAGVVAPLAALVALVAYASDPAGRATRPFAGGEALPEHRAPLTPPGGRSVGVPPVPVDPAPPAPPTRSGAGVRPDTPDVPVAEAPPVGVIAGPVVPRPAGERPAAPAPERVTPDRRVAAPRPAAPSPAVEEPVRAGKPLFGGPGAVPADGEVTAPDDSGCAKAKPAKATKAKKKPTKAQAKKLKKSKATRACAS